MKQNTVKELTLQAFLSELDRHPSRVPLALLGRGLRRLRFSYEEIEKYAQFSTERYRRNLMHAGPAYHALILCWRNGQRSLIHDHRGSSCAVLVIRGAATETKFAMTPHGHVYPTSTRILPEGHLCATQDNDIHQLSNLQPNQGDLVTLHIYSPPLLVMGQYSLTEPTMREFADEVCAFSEGAGI